MDHTAPLTPIGETWCTRRHLMAPDQEMTYSLVRSSSLIRDKSSNSSTPAHALRLDVGFLRWPGDRARGVVGVLGNHPSCHRSKADRSRPARAARLHGVEFHIEPADASRGSPVTLRAAPPGLHRTRITLPTCRPTSPGGPATGAQSVASPGRAAFPGSPGRHPRLHDRGLLGLHSNYGPLDRSDRPRRPCHSASIHPVTRTNRHSLPDGAATYQWYGPSSRRTRTSVGARARRLL